MQTLSTKNRKVSGSRTLPFVLIISALILLNGCAATASHHQYQPAPERWNEYHYFPNANVYYDSHRRAYHYHHAHKGWISVSILPHFINLDRHRYHVVRSRDYSPWKNRHAYKKHHTHYDASKKDKKYKEYNKNKPQKKHYKNKYEHQINYKDSRHPVANIPRLNRKNRVDHQNVNVAKGSPKKAALKKKYHEKKRKNKKQKLKKSKNHVKNNVKNTVKKYKQEKRKQLPRNKQVKAKRKNERNGERNQKKRRQKYES